MLEIEPVDFKLRARRSIYQRRARGSRRPLAFQRLSRMTAMPAPLHSTRDSAGSASRRNRLCSLMGSPFCRNDGAPRCSTSTEVVNESVDHRADGGNVRAEGVAESFEAFFLDAEPRLRRALVAAYGPERGREATAEALAWAWENWAAVEALANPVGYLYRVGQSSTRERKAPELPAPVPIRSEPWVEPELGRLLSELTEMQGSAWCSCTASAGSCERWPS